MSLAWTQSLESARLLNVCWHQIMFCELVANSQLRRSRGGHSSLSITRTLFEPFKGGVFAGTSVLLPWKLTLCHQHYILTVCPATCPQVTPAESLEVATETDEAAPAASAAPTLGPTPAKTTAGQWAVG